MEKDITIYDIAKEAGVSPATVSRVMTRNARVSAAKRKAVEEVISKYNFQPNAMARGLSDTKSKTIGLMVADIRNPYYANVAVECEIAAHERGYSVLLCNALNEDQLEDELLEKLYAQRVDAIMQVGCRTDALKSDPEYVDHVNRIAKSIPFVTTGQLENGDCYVTGIDHAEGMRAAFKHLRELGHSEIAMVGGNLGVRSTYEKWMQYLYLMGSLNLPVREEFMQSGSYDNISGHECMNSLLDLAEPPTAVIAVNDFSAVGALQALHERGFEAPGDISLISYDNTYLAESVTPKLTTIDYNYPAFALMMVDTAIRLIRDEEMPRKQLLTPTLVKRDSCAAPRGNRFLNHKAQIN